MDAQGLKDHIIENPEGISLILESLGCHKIKEYSREYRSALPNKTNHTAVVVKKDNLSARIYTDGKTVKGDIFTIVCKLKGWEEDGSGFVNSLKYCHQVLGLTFDGVKSKKDEGKHPLDFFRKIDRESRAYGSGVEEQEVNEYDESILDEYVKLPHISFFQAGIMPQVQREYGICFSIQDDRIVIPHYKHDDKTKIVGLVGRTTNEFYKEFMIPKYFNLIKGYLKNQNLYALSHHREHIKEAGVVKVFESEKSVLQLATMKDKTGVAVGSHEITPLQRKLLIELDVEIVICFDKDVSEEHVINTAKYFAKFRPTSYVYDKYDLIGENDSPTDRGYTRWNYLYKHRIEV